MHQSPSPHQPPDPPVTPYEPYAPYDQQPWLDGVAAPGGWPHAPHPGHPGHPGYPGHPGHPGGAWGRTSRFSLSRLWDNKALRATALIGLLSLSGLVILALVREQTGTKGFLVGLGLAVLPVPLIISVFRWLDRVDPKPWRNLIFAFAWGACAATLVALIANGFATEWLMTTIADSSSPGGQADADTWGATFVAPFVEESAKAAAVLLLFVFRRRDFNGIVDGVVVAGITATGFAFTENILYLGSAFVSDQEFGYSGIRSTTAATFFIRGVMSPFAHPLFTAMTGVGFGLAAAAAAHQRTRRILLPIAALLAAMVLHGLWNGSSTLGGYGFIIVYAAFMVPVFGLLTWLTIWSRNNELRTVLDQLTAYRAAGWLTPPEPFALSSMRARGIARDLARRSQGAAAARAVGEYIASATSLAFLRRRAYRGTAGPDFTTRERELLDVLWERRETAQPALAHAALSLPLPYPGPPQTPIPPPYWPTPPYGGYGYGYGAPGYGPQPPHPTYALPPSYAPQLPSAPHPATVPYGPTDPHGRS
ncbi:PrsW family intramembrane metalloprotease [Streptomyces sp. NPDC059850]|uniref:PrsW family intramembrane metalloprotease n=1 Tax=Streptomyces sp. NPDC059850 TaxID=3346970 RepID=UPI003663D4F3